MSQPPPHLHAVGLELGSGILSFIQSLLGETEFLGEIFHFLFRLKGTKKEFNYCIKSALRK